MNDKVIVEKNYRGHPHIALVKLNRPKVLNALSSEVINELVEIFFKLDDDEDVRLSILTGDERAFAAGADISQMAKATPVSQIKEARFRGWSQLAMTSKPIIAAVDGFALGGGCELAMNCDMIIASDKAKFGQPEIKIGTIPGAGGTQRLTRAIGKARAMWMIMTGEMIDAQTAFEWGLVTKVVPAQALMDETFELAKLLATRAPMALRWAKESINKSQELSLQNGIDYERRLFYMSFATNDQKEGMQAFLEKRDPDYKGN